MWQCEHKLCLRLGGFWEFSKLKICSLNGMSLISVLLLLFFTLQAYLLLGNPKYISFFLSWFTLYKDRAISLIMKAWFSFVLLPPPHLLLTWIVFVFSFPTLLEDGSKTINGFGPAAPLKDCEGRKKVSFFATNSPVNPWHQLCCQQMQGFQTQMSH